MPINPSAELSIRSIRPDDYPGWRPLWDAYNAFYGRYGETALDEHITLTTWARFLQDSEPVHALIAESQGQIVGIVHYVFHRSTTRLADVCYLQDLYTIASQRGKGIGRQLIESVYAIASESACRRVYWQTHESNAAGRLLYDKLAQNKGFIVYSHES
ncbi:MAG: GNAT family N-acetyltransferase [Aquitalea sp.]|nr:GNAT family N-acetyltransferase [Aquitalea sp.]